MPGALDDVTIEPFRIEVAEEVLEDLRHRIRHTRWPDEIPGVGWEQGTERKELQDLLTEWAEGFDWRARERELNALSHFRAELDGLRLHFIHERGAGRDRIPLILTHGWPSTFLEMVGLVPLLTDPASHGIDGPGFDVVIPSLPGYGFSDRPRRTGMTTRAVAGLWHELMELLGYERYGAYGSDFGASVTTFMALDRPEPLTGIHLSTLDDAPYTGSGSRPLSEAESAYLEQNRAWHEAEYAYARIQSTKPQTVGYGLNDSPAGLAAWVVEKWRAWSDSGGELESRFSRDLLLTNLTIYWATQTITSSVRLYFDNRRFGHAMGPDDFVRVPTAVAVFAKQFAPEGTPPREWAERLYDIRRWTTMPSGGHFAALEEPELLARDIVAFFGDLARMRQQPTTGSPRFQGL